MNERGGAMMGTSPSAGTVDAVDEWETVEWEARQDDREIVVGALTQGLFSRITANPTDVAYRSLPQADLDHLEQAFGDPIVCFDDGVLQIDVRPGPSADPHVTCRRVHVTLRRTEWELVRAASAAVFGLLAKDTASGAGDGVDLLQRLAHQAPSLSAAQKHVLSASLLD
jgi:hypothetical protein